MLELDRAENRIVFNRQRGEQLDARERELGGESERAAAQLAELDSQAEAQNSVVNRLREESAALESALSSLLAAASEAAAASDAASAQVTDFRRQIAELDAALAE